MPMCQSPRISEVLLRAKTAAANDNNAPITKGLQPFESGGAIKAVWSRLLLTGFRRRGNAFLQRVCTMYASYNPFRLVAMLPSRSGVQCSTNSIKRHQSSGRGECRKTHLARQEPSSLPAYPLLRDERSKFGRWNL